ncbi:hypothetical protein M8C21_006389 [Ambrosia artemisiifolia]|uniref:Uncharacterized protein n=1 Tax=Ambrosia artemisiifolia TaxID=4212 RepID=A0AAD5BK25_AMBAR|nr:hypothetical protein M8C21_006389 [Ambrosia artemisiifolia]
MLLMYLAVLSSALGGLLILNGGVMVAEGAAVQVTGNISKIEDASYFRIYYGKTFKVIKNDLDGKSYLLIQSDSKMAIKTKYCTPRIKSFVIPLANFSMDVSYFPVSFFERAEWIKYLGVFANVETRANEIYDVVKSNYQCLVKSAASKKIRPIVAWMEFNDGVWTFTKDAYKLKTVDVLIDGTLTQDPFDYNGTMFLQNLNIEDQSCLAFLSHESVWRHDKRLSTDMALDWFDGAVSQPQLVLADMIEMLFPTGSYTTTYFRNLLKGEEVTILGLENCNRDTFTAMEPTTIACT